MGPLSLSPCAMPKLPKGQRYWRPGHPGAALHSPPSEQLVASPPMDRLSQWELDIMGQTCAQSYLCLSGLFPFLHTVPLNQPLGRHLEGSGNKPQHGHWLKAWTSRTLLPGPGSQLYPLMAMWPWTNYHSPFPSLSSSVK